MELSRSYFKAYAYIQFKRGGSAEKILKKLKESKLDINFVRNVGAKWWTKKNSKRLKILYRCMIMHLPMQRNQQRLFFLKDNCNCFINLLTAKFLIYAKRGCRKKRSNTCGKRFFHRKKRLLKRRSSGSNGCHEMVFETELLSLYEHSKCVERCFNDYTVWLQSLKYI